MKLDFLTKQDYVEGEATAPNIFEMQGLVRALGRARLLPSLRRYGSVGAYGSAGASPSRVMNSLGKLL